MASDSVANKATWPIKVYTIWLGLHVLGNVGVGLLAIFAPEDGGSLVLLPDGFDFAGARYLITVLGEVILLAAILELVAVVLIRRGNSAGILIGLVFGVWYVIMGIVAVGFGAELGPGDIIYGVINLVVGGLAWKNR